MIKTVSAARAFAVVTAAISAALATPAAAQSATGQVRLTGFVASRCGVGGDTGTIAPTFGGTIALGELSDAEGRLRAALINSTAAAPAGTLAIQAGCSGSTARVTINGTRFSNANPALGDGVGGISLSNDIDYTIQGAMALSGGGITTLSYTTAATLPAPSSLAITEPFAFTPGNFEVRIFGLRPEGGNQSVLVAGNYEATITVTITPT